MVVLQVLDLSVENFAHWGVVCAGLSHHEDRFVMGLEGYFCGVGVYVLATHRGFYQYLVLGVGSAAVLTIHGGVLFEGKARAREIDAALKGSPNASDRSVLTFIAFRCIAFLCALCRPRRLVCVRIGTVVAFSNLGNDVVGAYHIRFNPMLFGTFEHDPLPPILIGFAHLFQAMHEAEKVAEYQGDVPSIRIFGLEEAFLDEDVDGRQKCGAEEHHTFSIAL